MVCNQLSQALQQADYLSLVDQPKRGGGSAGDSQAMSQVEELTDNKSEGDEPNSSRTSFWGRCGLRHPRGKWVLNKTHKPEQMSATTGVRYSSFCDI